MLHSFVHIHPELLNLLASHTLVTPNERLAREYRRGYQVAMQAASPSQAWRTANILSLQQFLSTNYAQLQDIEPDTQPLLEQHELLAMAYAALEHPTTPLVTNLLKNWAVMQQYSIPLTAAANSNVFQDWYLSFEQSIRARGKVPALLIGDLLVAANWVPKQPVLTTALDELTRPQERYLDTLCTQGLVSYVSPDGSPMLAELAADLVADLDARTGAPAVTPGEVSPNNAGSIGLALSQVDEITAAVTWAKQTKIAHPSATIGIVVPDLDHRHKMIRRAAGSILDPMFGSRTNTFDISGGTPLSEEPVWLHASRFLKMLLDSTSYRAINEAWSSPFMTLSKTIGNIQKWPKPLGRLCTMQALFKYHKSTTTTELLSILATAAKPTKITHTTRQLRRVLNLVGWPNLGDLESNQYQAFQQIDEILSRLENQHGGQDHVDMMQTLDIIDHLLGETVSSEQRAEADILILGALETTGLRFDHLWVCGMDAQSFPGVVSNPSYISAQVAAQYNVPRSTQAAEASFCRRQLERWRNQCDDMRFSFVARAGDAEVAPSPLLRDCELEIITEAPLPWERQNSQLERYWDERARSVVDQPARTGVRLLQHQADCAFKAFAEFRLGIEDEREPRLLVDALGRGNLVHGMLFHLMSKHRSKDELANVTSKDIELAVEQSFIELAYPLPERFKEHEQRRLATLCQAWLKVELARPDFKIVDIEQAFDLQLGRLKLRVRIDRQDVIDDKHAIIDYKTGRASIAGLKETPLTKVQLPIYAQLGTPAGVFYGAVNDKPKYLGLSDSAIIARGSEVGDWDRLQARWQKELTQLADAFLAGEARVAPNSPSACQYCHLHALCRIGSQNEEQSQ